MKISRCLSIGDDRLVVAPLVEPTAGEAGLQAGHEAAWEAKVKAHTVTRQVALL